MGIIEEWEIAPQLLEDLAQVLRDTGPACAPAIISVGAVYDADIGPMGVCLTRAGGCAATLEAWGGAVLLGD